MLLKSKCYLPANRDDRCCVRSFIECLSFVMLGSLT